jgi:hypothetical protein
MFFYGNLLTLALSLHLCPDFYNISCLTALGCGETRRLYVESGTTIRKALRLIYEVYALCLSGVAIGVQSFKSL